MTIEFNMQVKYPQQSLLASFLLPLRVLALLGKFDYESGNESDANFHRGQRSNRPRGFRGRRDKVGNSYRTRDLSTNGLLTIHKP
jgi:hypothetical protein